MPMLQPIADHMWGHEYWLKLGPGLWFPVRMTVVKLSDGTLWLHSPSSIDDALAAELDAIGPVSAIVEPNLFHHLHAQAAQQRYPDAVVYGVPGHEKKQKALQFTSLDDVGTLWASDFEMMHVPGAPMLEERVFLHKASKTLLLTDLVFNILEVKGWMSHLVFRMVGAYKRLAQSRSVRIMAKDKAAFGGALATVLQWEFSRVVMAHGAVVDDDAKAQLAQTFAWCVPQTAPLPALPSSGT